MHTTLTAICLCNRDIFWDWTLNAYRHAETQSLYCPEGGLAEPQPGTEEAEEEDPLGLATA
jgi:hypothetical protein